MTTPSDLVIRRADREDAEGLARLNVEVQQMHAEAYPDLFKPVEGPDFAVPFFHRMLTLPEVHIFLAEREHPVGYIFARIIHREGNPFMYPHAMLYIEHIGVDPESQGQGVGAALMARVDELAQELGMDVIALDTWGFNTGAHGFFQAQGYETFNLRMWKRRL